MGTLQEGPTVQDVSNYHCRKQTQMLFRKVSDKLKWNLHDMELLMDVGCGSGERSTKYITFLYPRATEIIAIDPRKELIAEAKKFNQYSKVDYVVADISDWDSLEMWKGKVSHMVSLRYLNFVLDQRLAFDNMFHLLKTDGEVVLLFPTGAEVYQYIQNDTILVPEAIERRWDREMYELLLEEVGFTVIEVSDVTSESFVYPSEELFKEYSQKYILAK
ncbi:methyltransf_25 domain-containing protein [Trichonephila inaurata madagascariensis]|uniref:Methyltransf_25 domain-containing protein n=1 Tax=Trichonephila inaurata madagascariensis TaxID=2747483 RepID=A0A8X6Y6F0_9ARAC|nr:methyltransf_25 domain-containing protein [Trichonephila inaurata madagascariensis]